VGLVEFLVYVVTGVQVLRWIRRANANLHAAGMAAMEFTPNWTAGRYFVPVGARISAAQQSLPIQAEVFS